MADRADARVYRQALAELRDKHAEEFEAIRRRLLQEQDVKINVVFTTDRDRQLVYDYLRMYIDVHKQSPTISEITRALKIGSTEKIRKIVHYLAADGKITVQLNKRRSIELVEKQ